MQSGCMRRLSLFFIWCACVALLSSAAHAGTYTLTDGQSISGEPISFNEQGLIVKAGESPPSDRIPWNKFTQESLKQLFVEAKNPRDKALIEPLLEEVAQEKVKRKEIIVKPVEHPDRPTKGTGIAAMFSSPIGWTIFLILYLANLFAAYEVAIYRFQSLGLVCGLAAIPFLGVLSPIIFLSMPPQLLPPELTPAQAAAAQAEETFADSDPLVPVAETYSHSQEVAEAIKPVLPEPIIFSRSDFSFNRRFFETKLAGFMRVVPGEAEKDLVLYVKSLRGDFVARRVTQIGANDLQLQIFKNNVTADELIPFIEIQEVQIRHQDSF